MTLGVILGRKGKVWSVLVGPEVDFATQRRGFYELCQEARGTYDEVQLISTRGRVKRRKLKGAPVEAVVDGDDSSEGNEENTGVVTDPVIPTSNETTLI